jgi:hypothetical protein
MRRHEREKQALSPALAALSVSGSDWVGLKQWPLD